MRRQNAVQGMLRVIADSIEKSVLALRQLLAEGSLVGSVGKNRSASCGRGRRRLAGCPRMR